MKTAQNYEKTIGEFISNFKYAFSDKMMIEPIGNTDFECMKDGIADVNLFSADNHMCWSKINE